MSVEIVSVRGPLDDERLGWITELYGPVDQKYGSIEFVRHQFVRNPFGWSAHIFVLDDGRPAGHCSAIPFRARRGSEELVAGKIEAVVVDPEHRGRRPDGRNLAIEMLSTLYPFGLDCGMDGLFGFAPPRVARVHVRAGCHEVAAEAPAYTFLLRPNLYMKDERSRKRRVSARLLTVGQTTAVGAGHAAARVTSLARTYSLEQPGDEDAALGAAHRDDTAWTVSGDDAWEWYAGSGTLQTLHIPGRWGCRAIIRVAAAPGTSPAQIVAWRPNRAGIRPGFLLLGAAARVAREHGAPTLRFQPWDGDGGDGELARACALLGFVRRPEASLVVFSRDPRFDALRVTPFFYATF
jgi:hypothetical protein